MAPNSIVENGARGRTPNRHALRAGILNPCVYFHHGHVRNNRGQVRDWQEKTESLLYFQSVLISIYIN